MPRSAVVMLAGQAYTVVALPIGKAKAWRERLAGPFGDLVGVLEGAGEIELTNGRDIAGLVRTLSGTLIGSMDQLLDLLFAYAPALAADRERIEAEAYDDEALRAFAEVLKLAYPFGELRALISGSGAARTTR